MGMATQSTFGHPGLSLGNAGVSLRSLKLLSALGPPSLKDPMMPYPKAPRTHSLRLLGSKTKFSRVVGPF